MKIREREFKENNMNLTTYSNSFANSLFSWFFLFRYNVAWDITGVSDQIKQLSNQILKKQHQPEGAQSSFDSISIMLNHGMTSLT